MEVQLLALPSKSKPSDAMSVRSALSARSARSHHSAAGSVWNTKEERGRVPHPSHRHAAPSAPWPWVDLDDEVDRKQLECPLPPIPPQCDHRDCRGRCWKEYPQSRFPNWTKRQVRKSKILDAITNYSRDSPCICHRVDVDVEGLFKNPGPIVAKHGEEDRTWGHFIDDERPTGLRVRALFIENVSGPVLKMLGAKYNIEPFFWSSSLNWIPSRFQDDVKPGIGDHITLTLTFVRSMSQSKVGYAFGNSSDTLQQPSTLLGTQKIDPHSPLILHSNDRLLVLDLLAVHLIRNIHGSTIISLHPTMDLPATTASFLHERIRFAGQSVYWQTMFQKHSDPTFLLLVFVWHAMYAWDEALDNLYDHICNLESRVIQTEDMPLTQELHVLRAHHLHYSSLLDDASKNVAFIRDTHNPAMDSDDFKEDRESSKKTLTRECANLLAEISRLKGELQMQERRLKNVMDLVFSSVNIHDSQYTRIMTEATVRDSAGKNMKQVAYLTMVFLPATFMSGVFGMNIKEINPGTLGTVKLYFTVTIPLTAATVWIITAFESTYIFPKDTPFVKRMGWPIYLLLKMFNEWRKARRGDGTEFNFNISNDSEDAVKSKTSLSKRM